jgi:hypothetical protein
MPVKKKIPMPKSAEKRSVPELLRPRKARNGQLGGKVAGIRRRATRDPSQMESFEEGMRLFHARKFQQAREFFHAGRWAGRIAPWPTAPDCTRACASSAWNPPARC